MKRIKPIYGAVSLLLLALLTTYLPTAARGDQVKKDDPIDILHYKIQAEINPETHILSAETAVKFLIVKSTQSAVFEMNGSLKVSKVTTADGRDLQFIQDTLDALNVRVDLGAQAPVGQETTLIFKYEGALVSSEGGVLPNKRLAYIGPEGSYLTYASRWFPFHGYAADVFTYEISLITPPDTLAAGFGPDDRQSKPYAPPVPEPAKIEPLPEPKAAPKKTPGKPEQPSKPAPPKLQRKPPSGNNFVRVSYAEPQQPPASAASQRTVHSFTSKKPVFGGTFAIGRYILKTIKSAGIDVDFYVKPGNEAIAEKFAQETSSAIGFYSGKFGPYAFGNRLCMAEIDNESLDTYTTAGITLLADKLFRPSTPLDYIYKETAFQWWGQAVALKSFDDAFISQGLAQYSALALEESQSSEAAFRETARQAMERALSFESQTSITRAPAELDDQSEAYRSIVYYKGAFVFRMLRILVGDEKFDAVLRTYYEQYKDKQAGISDFEKTANAVLGRDMRYFFGQWVDSTGVPEFGSDYQMIKTRDGGFKVRGSIKQDVETFNMPVDVELVYEGGSERTQVQMQGKEAEFTLASKGKPLDIVIDPDSKILKINDGIRVAVIVRRGIEHFRNDEYPEAEQQLQAAIKLNRGSSWAWYNLGLLYFAQKNFQKANETFGEALELDLQPRWVEVWSYIKRGNCYDALGNRDRAVAEYNKAIALGDNYDGAQELAQQYLSAPYRRNQNEQSKAD